MYVLWHLTSSAIQLRYQNSWGTVCPVGFVWHYTTAPPPPPQLYCFIILVLNPGPLYEVNIVLCVTCYTGNGRRRSGNLHQLIPWHRMSQSVSRSSHSGCSLVPRSRTACMGMRLAQLQLQNGATESHI